MTLPETLGANVTRLVQARADSDGTKLRYLWSELAREGWPDDSGATNRAKWIKRVARGERWPDPANLETLAGVLGVEAWELLRPAS